MNYDIKCIQHSSPGEQMLTDIPVQDFKMLFSTMAEALEIL
jgi:hypothetical protein